MHTMTLRTLPIAFLAFALVTGCNSSDSGDDDDSSQGGMEAGAGGSGTPGAGGAGGMETGAGGMETGAGGMETGAGGMETGAGGMEAGAGGMEAGAGGMEPMPFMADCSMPNQMCYTPRAAASGTPRMMIQVVDVPRNIIQVVNRSNDPIDMDGWVAVQKQATTPLMGMVVEPFATLDLEFGTMASEGATAVGGESVEMVDELALYEAADTNEAANLRVYLAWGDATESQAAEHAAQLGLWPAGEYAGICGENVGLLAVGDVHAPAGYRSVPAECF